PGDRRTGDRPLRRRGGRRIPLSGRGAEGADGRGLPRHPHSRAVRGRGRGRDRHLHRDRGGRTGRRQRLADPRGQQARLDADHPVRLRGREAAGPAVDRRRRRDDQLRALGARGRLRRRCDEDPRAPGRRQLGAQRHQGLDHQLRDLGVVHGHGGHRPGKGLRRHLGVRRAPGRPGLRRRPQGTQDGHQGLAHVRAVLHRLHHPGRPDHRGARHGLQDRAADAGLHPAHHRRAGGRRRAGRAGRVGGLRQGTQAVRDVDRLVPGRAVHARRHGDEDRGRPAPGLRRRGGGGAGPAGRHPGVGLGEGVRLRRRHAGDHRRRPALRRRRVHAGLPRRADDARREDHP
ncbi:Acyl-CoA dehydrogenase, partial [Blastococcus mobilis]